MTVIHAWQAVVLGAIEGLTEFLPVSSTAHLRIGEALMGLPTGSASVVGYTALIQVGAIAAVIVYFARDLWALASTGVRGLFFPFLPGDTLIVAIGLFLAGDKLSILPGGPLIDLAAASALLVGSAFLGNVIGFEIGNRLGPVIYEHDGTILKRDYFDRTERFFDRHGRKALVIGRFVPVVRTYITVVAGASKMKRPRFFVWSLVGALLWVLSILLTGYFVGDRFPFLAHHVDYLVLGLLLLMVIPAGIHWWRERGSD